MSERTYNEVGKRKTGTVQQIIDGDQVTKENLQDAVWSIIRKGAGKNQWSGGGGWKGKGKGGTGDDVTTTTPTGKGNGYGMPPSGAE